ncbi:MAG TPA: response regulator [Acetobacteraceae bacterium]|nr:response regulator [Acetobacteraceae bacterium]
MVRSLLPGVIAAFVLLGLGLLAWRQWRGQREAMARLRDEVRRREAVEEALRESQKVQVIGRLTRGIAHDFNNHLTVISSNIELLQRRLPADSAALLRLTNAAMAGVQRAATLTHRLVAASRQQPLDPEPLDVGYLVTSATDMLRRTLGEDIAVQTVLAPGLWQTRVDANQLENVLLNLAVNARDAMPDGGRLTIETANACLDTAYAAAHPRVSSGQYVLLAVSDTGAGSGPDACDDASAGLGLSAVRGFARQSGGHVALDSSPGKGTTVRIYLPRIGDEAAPAPPSLAAATPHRRGPGETILVVEDDEDVRRSSVEALREMGYEVLEAGDAMDAVRLIVDRGGIDLLFTDVGLPGGVSGSALADAARSAQPGLRVLFTTGYTRNNGPIDGVQFIAKPFSLAALAAKVREVMAEPDRTAQTRVES